MLPLIHAILLGFRLLLQALLLVLVGAGDRASLNTLPASHAALRPLGHAIDVASGRVFAILLRRGLRGKSTLVVVPGGAQHLAGLNRFPALRAALPPRVHHPLRPIRVERCLHRQSRRQRWQLVVLGAAQRPLAHQAALRLRADLRVPAVPGAPRRVAHVLAGDTIRARQPADCAGALCCTLGGAALLTGSRCARVWRAEHGAVRGLAVDLALAVVRPRAPGLASRLLAIRGAVLVASGLRAVPGALREARLRVALNHFIRGG
mmetsp:Transcript_17323/g.41704  ORF Transcript_17323/g.41704 Transcript_17323/m.41704 type:complete len:263 (+) Transcript_17323:758-1546(+)